MVTRFVLALGLVVTAAPTSAQVIDLKGTWKGTGEGIVDGRGARPHSPGHDTSTPHRLRTQEFVYKFDGQDGKRFWGTISSEYAGSLRIIGSLSFDGKWIYVAAHEGLADGVVVDNDTIQMCYRHVTSATAVVSCNELKRQK